MLAPLPIRSYYSYCETGRLYIPDPVGIHNH